MAYNVQSVQEWYTAGTTLALINRTSMQHLLTSPNVCKLYLFTLVNVDFILWKCKVFHFELKILKTHYS